MCALSEEDPDGFWVRAHERTAGTTSCALFSSFSPVSGDPYRGRRSAEDEEGAGLKNLHSGYVDDAAAAAAHDLEGIRRRHATTQQVDREEARAPPSLLLAQIPFFIEKLFSPSSAGRCQIRLPLASVLLLLLGLPA